MSRGPPGGPASLFDPPSRAAVERACALASSLAGADIAPYKETLVLRRLRTRARDLRLPGVCEYLDSLEAAGPNAVHELRRLASSLTVRVSTFFRDPEVFRELEETAFPELLAQRGPHGIRVWSAACSRGQEAYSLALLLWRFAREQGVDCPLMVLATDLDEASLSVAQAATYPASSAQGVPPELLDEGFRLLPGERLEVREEVRRIVRFQRANLLLPDLHPSDMDLVSCRNLLIYLRRDVQENLILQLSEALRPGGFLLLGQSETILGRPWRALEHTSPSHRIYRKPE